MKLLLLLLLCVAKYLPAENHYVLSNIKVKDADTIVCDIDLGYGVFLKQETIRCSDYDACESSRVRKTVVITDEELKRGKEATVFLEKLLKESQYVILSPQENHWNGKRQRDNYGRILGILTVYHQEKMVNGNYITIVEKVGDQMLDKKFLRSQLPKE